MARVLLVLFALLALGLTAGPGFGQEHPPRVNPLTGKPYGPKALAEYEAAIKQQKAEEEAARAASEEAEQRWQEARARNAEQIRAFDEAIEDWQEDNPAPAGTRESLVATSYDNDTALGEHAEITYYNNWDVPTHKVQFGPDGKPTGPVTQTQQGKAWETIGPRIPPGGGVEISYGEDFDGNEIITEAHIFDAGGKSFQTYAFNFDGIPWRGETLDPETGLRNGGFQDDRFKPPERTVGGPLAVPPTVRLITGVCDPCRALATEHNDLANEINTIIAEMASLSREHMHAYPPAQKPIRMRYEVLEKRLAELMPRFEALRARLLDCERQCRPPAQTPVDDGPSLARPQFERVREFTIPSTFCNAFERNDFLNNIYNPAVASALANARTAQAHQAKLNALFTEHMKANSPHWAAVRAERDAYEAITNEALTRSGALNDLYVKIMAVPITPCAGTGDEADPVGEEPAGQTGQAGPTGPGEPRVEEGLPGFRSFEPLPPPGRFCTREEAEAYIRQVEARTAEIRGERDRLEEAVGASLGTNRTFLDTLWAPGEKDRLTDAEIRKREEEFYVSQGLIALSLSGRSMREFTNADAASYGRTRAALGTVGVQMLLEYDTQLKALEASRTKAEDMIAKGQFGPCPKDGDEPKKPCPPKNGRDPITVGANSKVGSGARLRAKVGGMALGALAGALGGGGGGGGGSDGPDLWTCKIKESEYTVFDDPATGVSLRVGAKRAKGGKVVIFSEIARSPDKGTFQTAFLENPMTGETQAPGDVGPCDLWGEWKLTVSWTKTTYVDGQMVSQESGGWQETGRFSIPGVLSKVDAPDGLWKRMGFSNASNGAREIGMIYDVPPGGGPLTFVIHVTRPRGDPVTTVPFVLTMTEGPNGFAFTKAEDPPCPPGFQSITTDSPLVSDSRGLTLPAMSDPGGLATGSATTPSTARSSGEDGEDPGDSDDRPSGPTPEEAYAVQRAETGAQELVAAWRASDADLLTLIRNQKDCDPTIRDRLLAGFRERERMLEEGGGDIFNVAIRRAFELDGPRMNALKDLLGENACPATTLVTAPPPLALASEAPLPPPQPALPPPPPPQALPAWYVDHLPMVQAASSGNLESMRELIDEADKKPCPDGYKTVLDRIRWSRDEFRRMVPRGRGADSMRDVIDETLKRLDQMEDEVLKKMAASRCPPSGSVFRTDGPDPTPAPYTPPPGGSTGPRLPFSPPPERPISEPAKVDRFVSEGRTADTGLAKALEEAARACPADPARSWTALRNRARAVLVARLMFLSSLRPMGPGTEQMTEAVGREFNRTMLLLQEVNALQPPPCPGQAPDQQPTEEETESILDDIEERLVIG